MAETVFDASFIDEIVKEDNERKQTIGDFVNNMTRPDRVIPEDEEEEDDDDSASDSEGGDKDSESDKGSANSDSSKSDSGDTFNLFEILELDNIAEWYEEALIFGAEKVHDYFDDSDSIAQVRDNIVNTLANPTLNLTDDQKSILKKRYEELGEALKERKEGRAELKEDIEFPDKIKEKFNQAFKKWFESKSLNIDLSPGWTLILISLAMMVYSGVIVFKARSSYKKV